MHANPFPLSQNHATELLELIHSDVHDIGIVSPSGYIYWISFIDDHCRFKVLVPMKHKSDAFKSFKAYAENKTRKQIKQFRIDKGGEYMSNEFSSYLEACGIKRQFTCRNRPQQNGVAERANRLFAERIVALLNESGLSKRFWVECLAALVHVLNICPTSALLDKTPHKIWHQCYGVRL
jgi:transposase InsO family protein